MNKEFRDWKKKVHLLELMWLRIEELYNQKIISEKEKEKKEKKLNYLWMNLEDITSSKNPSLKQAFKSCFWNN